METPIGTRAGGIVSMEGDLSGGDSRAFHVGGMSVQWGFNGDAPSAPRRESVPLIMSMECVFNSNDSMDSAFTS